MAAHTLACQAVPPWKFREHARNTAHKCEKRQMPKGHKAMLAKAKAARKAPLPQEA